MLRTVETALGTTRTLLGIDHTVLEGLAGGLLGETRLLKCIGVSPPKTDEDLFGAFRKISNMGLIDRVQSAFDAPDEVNFLGVEIIRGRPFGGTAYDRPVAEDAPRDDASRSMMLLRTVHAQVPILEKKEAGEHHVEVSAGQLTMRVEPGDVFVPRPDTPYKVSVPPDTVNMELIFGKTGADPRAAWVEYMNIQPAIV